MTTMTKKDYTIIAEALRKSRPREAVSVAFTKDTYRKGVVSGKYIQYAMMTTEIMEALAAENPRFDKDKFVKAVNRKEEIK